MAAKTSDELVAACINKWGRHRGLEHHTESKDARLAKVTGGTDGAIVEHVVIPICPLV